MKSNWMQLIFQTFVLFATIANPINSVAAPDKETAEQEQIDKNWFKPAITENNSPLCTSFLSNTQHSFFSSKFYSGYQSSNEKILINGAYDDIAVDHVLIENKPVYIRVALMPGCGGACEGAQAITSLAPIKAGNDHYGYAQENTFINMPPATNVNNTLFVEAEDRNYYLISINSEIQIHKLLPDASWKKSCTISITPTDEDYSKSDLASSARATIKKLNSAMQPIMGNYGNCGSSRAGARQLHLLNELLDVAIYRPWVLGQYDDTSKFANEYLEEWSNTGIPQHNSYTLLKDELAITKVQMKKFYIQQYGWSNEHATQTTNAIINNALSRAIIPAPPPQAEERKKILNALLKKDDISIIKSASTWLASFDNTDSRVGFNDTLISSSINYPEALAYLLQQKLSPDTPNAFGKTPLMYAAQYNQLASVKLLLNAGAAVNAETIIPTDDCNYTLSKYGMTALHYAVRYSSKEIIELLLEKGANPFAKTSEKDGGRPIDWIKKYTIDAKGESNPNLSIEDAKKFIPRLQMPSPDEIQRQVKNFNLDAEKKFQDGKKEDAYITVKKALALDPLNDRALANASLIAIRTGRILEGLQASQTVISNSTDVNQKANALFNYALACENNNITYDRYNGEIYCKKYPVYYLLESHNLKPAEAKAKKVVQSFLDNKIPVCTFSSGIYIANKMSTYGTEKVLYLLRPANAVIDLTTINFMSDKKIYQPEKLLKSHQLGNYSLDIYQSSVSINTPIHYKNEECKSDAYNKYNVEK